MVTVIMQDNKYASVGQLMQLAQQNRYNDMYFLLTHFNYSRYAISRHRKSIINNDTPKNIVEIVADYYESALATI